MRLLSLFGLLALAVTLSRTRAFSSRVTRSLKSHAKTWSKHAVRRSMVVVVGGGRRRRAVSPMTPAETTEVVDRHNALRAAERAGNMELMVRLVTCRLCIGRQFCSVLFFSRPRSEGWPHHGRTFSIYPCPLSF